MKYWFIPLFGILLFSCKTTEEIRRDQEVQNLNLQISQAQKIYAESIMKVDQLQERVTILTSALEETGHARENKLATTVEEFDVRLKSIEAQQAVQKEQVNRLLKQGNEVQRYLTEVNKALKGMTGSAPKAVRSKKPKSEYSQAMSLYKSKKYDEAFVLLDKLSKKKLKSAQLARILHNLGMIAYKKKKYHDATVYFSKLYTNHPKNWYAHNGLIYMAKSFKADKDIEGAKGSLNQLITNHPKSDLVKRAKKELEKLK